jgi:hypothetical protein
VPTTFIVEDRPRVQRGLSFVRGPLRGNESVIFG